MIRRPPDCVTRRAWKSFAASSFSTAEIQPTNETSIAHIDFAEFLGFRKVLSLKRESYAFLKEEIPGPVDKMITMDMVHEAVRELTDLNFFDMFEVEYRRTYDAPDDICKRMEPVMQRCSFSVPAPIPRSELSDWALWLLAVRDFIQDWQGAKPPRFNTKLPNPVTLRDVVLLESAIAKVYCSNVMYILRRHPIIPRYLEMTPLR